MNMRVFKAAAIAVVLLGLPLLGAPTALAAADAAAPHGAEPQLVKGPGVPEVVTAVTTLVIFAMLMAVLGKFAWGPIVSGLRKREEKIRREIADAEAARARAEATLAEYNTQLAAAEVKVRDMIAGAVTQGERVAADIRAKAVAEADEGRQRALREIEGARKQALAEIYERAAELSTGIAEKILRRNISVDDQRDLVRRSLEELQTVQR